jgi:antirestriction protein ArdC
MRDLYREITETIVAELKAGARPWVQPWSKTPGLNVPANAVTGRPYSGVNTLLLWTARKRNWPQPRFLTFKQARKAGGHVCAGEHGQHVVFVKDVVRRSDEAEDEQHRFRMLKSYTVFNLAQCEGLPDKLIAPPKAPNPDQRDALIDEFVAATGVKLHETSGDKAFYAHGDADFIVMPAFKLFRGRVHYAATLFHELIHWIGHPSRLNRQLGARFGLRANAAEELIAELGAAFLCSEFSIDGVVPHAAYLEDYLALLKDDPRAIFTAAAKAQTAVDFLRQRILAEPAADILVSSVDAGEQHGGERRKLLGAVS